jgi:hypothetical protein
MFNRKKKEKHPLITIDMSKITKEQLKSLIEGQALTINEESIDGDGKAVWLGEGTEEEYIDQKREDEGMKAWYKRLGL